ncbi:hypothetical protein [Calothrix sp. NIES-2098]|uniref:hypothetical protein n=1 Tax=Calothrix sp. NIES-2098 TaxID=1954171 RepID=UPI000BBBC39C
MTVTSSVCRFSVWAKPMAYTVQRFAKAVDARSDNLLPHTLGTPSHEIIPPRTPLRAEVIDL